MQEDKEIVIDEKQDTPDQLLMKGIELNNLNMVQKALSNNADFNKKNEHGYTPYRIATDNKLKQNPTIVRALINKGADVNDQSLASKFTPLHEAAYQCNIPLMIVLIELGADINRQSLNGKTPLHSVCDNNSLRHEEDVLIQTAEFLIQKGADINIVDKDGNNPLRWAAYWGHKNLVKMLITKGSSCQNTESFKHPSPLSHGNSNVGKVIHAINKEIQFNSNNLEDVNKNYCG